MMYVEMATWASEMKGKKQGQSAVGRVQRSGGKVTKKKARGQFFGVHAINSTSTVVSFFLCSSKFNIGGFHPLTCRSRK